jgi:hypothetical protein
MAGHIGSMCGIGFRSSCSQFPESSSRRSFDGIPETRRFLSAAGDATSSEQWPPLPAYSFLPDGAQPRYSKEQQQVDPGEMKAALMAKGRFNVLVDVLG